MNNTATKARDAEFIAICLDIIRQHNRSGRDCRLAEVIDLALARRPRCHYVSYDHASRILHVIHRAGLTAGENRLQRLKWLELYNQVKAAMEGPRRLSFDKALTFVLGFMRPSRFYIERERALRLLRPHISYKLYAN